MKRPIHSYLALFFLGFGMLAPSPSGYAAEQSDEQSRPPQSADAKSDEDATGTSTSATTSSTTSTTNKNEAQTNKQGNEPDKGFIPSEEISEDFAVSFPVDI